MSDEQPKPFISEEAYLLFRRLVEYVFPALGTLYFTIAQLWGLPYAEEVVGTIVALAAFFAVIVKLSRWAYQNDNSRFDAALVMDQSDPEQERWGFNIIRSIDEIGEKDEMAVKVVKLDQSSESNEG